METICQLSNRGLSESSNPDDIFYLFPSCVYSHFAHWVIRQTPKGYPIVIETPLKAFIDYIMPYFNPNSNIPTMISYRQLSDLIHSDRFEEIPEIMALNETRPDFIDLGALARNVFYEIVREKTINDAIDKKISERILNN